MRLHSPYRWIKVPLISDTIDHLKLGISSSRAKQREYRCIHDAIRNRDKYWRMFWMYKYNYK